MKVHAPPIFCALKYLLQWLREEQPRHRELRRTLTVDTVRSALAYFEVARAFPEIHLRSRAQFVVRAILDAESRTSLLPTERVVVLAEAFRSRFGSFNLPAASKLLWLRNRHPYVLLDTRVRKSLRSMGKRFDGRDYPQYVHAWREAYLESESTISQASAAVPALPGVSESVALSEGALRRLVAQPWFKERVFDIYLWERGGDG